MQCSSRPRSLRSRKGHQLRRQNRHKQLRETERTPPPRKDLQPGRPQRHPNHLRRNRKHNHSQEADPPPQNATRTVTAATKMEPSAPTADITTTAWTTTHRKTNHTLPHLPNLPGAALLNSSLETNASHNHDHHVTSDHVATNDPFYIRRIDRPLRTALLHPTCHISSLRRNPLRGNGTADVSRSGSDAPNLPRKEPQPQNPGTPSPLNAPTPPTDGPRSTRPLGDALDPDEDNRRNEKTSHRTQKPKTTHDLNHRSQQLPPHTTGSCDPPLHETPPRTWTPSWPHGKLHKTSPY